MLCNQRASIGNGGNVRGNNFISTWYVSGDVLIEKETSLLEYRIDRKKMMIDSVVTNTFMLAVFVLGAYMNRAEGFLIGINGVLGASFLLVFATIMNKIMTSAEYIRIDHDNIYLKRIDVLGKKSKEMKIQKSSLYDLKVVSGAKNTPGILTLRVKQDNDSYVNYKYNIVYLNSQEVAKDLKNIVYGNYQNEEC